MRTARIGYTCGGYTYKLRWACAMLCSIAVQGEGRKALQHN